MHTNRIALPPHSMSFWRGIAALEALLLVGAIAIGLASRWPVSQAPAPVAAPALRIPNSVAQAPAVAPAMGMGSYQRYGSGAYGPRPALRNPNVPISGTGSAYDGGAYGTVRPALHNPNMPISGTGPR